MHTSANLINPKTVNNRIYVGNLSSLVTPEILDIKFSTHGKVIGISKKAPSFCFLEFQNEISAQKAIELENETNLGGRRIIVKKVNLNQFVQKRDSSEIKQHEDLDYEPMCKSKMMKFL